MVHINYTFLGDQLTPQVFQHWFARLTPAMQNRLMRFRHWQDAQRGLLGKALLLMGYLDLFKHELDLSSIQYNEFEKPYINNGVSFNISHSGNLVVCAISATTLVGIDVEEICPIPLEDFSEQFSPAELNVIFSTKEDYTKFYNYWTQKEAFLKTIGTGLNIPLNQIAISDNLIELAGKSWYLQNIPIATGYACHIATEKEKPEFKLQKVDF